METIDYFRGLLPIKRHRLDDELEVYAEVLDRISKATAKANTRALQLKDELGRVEARLAAEIKDDSPKLSNPMVEAEIKRNRSRIVAWDAYVEARQEHEEWLGLQAAWDKRGYNLNTLANLYGMQYFAIDSTSRPRERASMHAPERPPARQFQKPENEGRSEPIIRRRLA